MERKIADRIADEVLKNIDLAGFAKELSPKLLKLVAQSIMESAKDIDWGEFLYDAIGTDAVGKELTKRLVAALKNGA